MEVRPNGSTVGLCLKVAISCSLKDSGSNLGDCNGVSVVDGLGWGGGGGCSCCYWSTDSGDTLVWLVVVSIIGFVA